MEQVVGLSKEEVLHFVTDVLGISNPLEMLKGDKKLLLVRLIEAYHKCIPFQSITVLSQSEAERHVPTWKEIKSDVMCGNGGICYTVGTFMNCLLDALGYDTYIPASYIGAGFTSMNHIATIVQNLTFPGSKHLVDACGYPTFEPIPLDFEKESPVYRHGFLEFKFVIEGNTVSRFHRRGDLYNSSDDALPGGWRIYAKMNLTPQEFSAFQQPMKDVYTKPGVNSPFLVSFRAILFSELKLVAIKDTTLMLENNSHEVEVTKLSSREEMVKVVTKYFPQFKVEDVKKAIDYLKLFG